MGINILENINDRFLSCFNLNYIFILKQRTRFIQRNIQNTQLEKSMSQPGQQREKESRFQKVQKQEQSQVTESEIKEIDYEKIQLQEAYEMSRKIMMAKAEENTQNLPQDCFLYQKVCEFSEIRKKYCFQILKYLLFGYLEMIEEAQIKKLLKEEDLIHKKSGFFIKQYPNIEKSRSILIQKVKEIEEKMFQFHNTAGNEQIQSRKYQFQIAHLLRNLSDPINQIFRQLIVNESYSPTMIASMDQIDMLQPSKKQYIFTKMPSLLNSQEKIQMKSLRYSKLQSSKTKNQRKEKKQKREKKERSYQLVQINKENMNLPFLLSNQFIQKLEIQLMQIPNRLIRKKTLTNLKSIFST